MCLLEYEKQSIMIYDGMTDLLSGAMQDRIQEFLKRGVDEENQAQQVCEWNRNANF